MNRKILFALSIAVITIIAFGTVSAFDISDLGSLFGQAPQDQNVTIDGENFTIPETFKENENNSDNGTVDDYYLFKVSDYEKRYSNESSYINIFITEYNTTEIGDELVNILNGTSKDINGIKGYLYSDDTGSTYTYAKDNKVISIQSDNEDLIKSVIA